MEEELYYLCGENKGADQLCSYCTADLRLCFAYANCWFSQAAAHLIVLNQEFSMQIYPDII